MSSSPSLAQFSFRTTSRLRVHKASSTRFSNHSTTNTSLYVHFLITRPRHCSRCCKPMVVSNLKSRGSMSQRRNFRTERYVVVRLVLQGLNFTDQSFQWSFMKLPWPVRWAQRLHMRLNVQQFVHWTPLKGTPGSSHGRATAAREPKRRRHTRRRSSKCSRVYRIKVTIRKRWRGS